MLTPAPQSPPAPADRRIWPPRLVEVRTDDGWHDAQLEGTRETSVGPLALVRVSFGMRHELGTPQWVSVSTVRRRPAMVLGDGVYPAGTA
jgi:hypothetical protein